MIGAVYGLQAIIFLVKREFMLIGWMVIYILACVALFDQSAGRSKLIGSSSLLKLPDLLVLPPSLLLLVDGRLFVG